MWAFREREKVLDIFEMTSGARLTCNYMRIGGVAFDIRPEFEPAVRKYLHGLSILAVPLIPSEGQMIGLVLLYPVWMVFLMFLFSVVSFAGRARREDKALGERFGEAWTDYKKRTKFLVPYIY